MARAYVGCQPCDRAMLRAYVRRGGRARARWVPIGWYCEGCAAFLADGEDDHGVAGD